MTWVQGTKNDRSDFQCPFFDTCGEICDCVSNDYLAAAKLMVEYDDLLMNDKNPDKNDFINRCPESERGHFIDCLQVSDIVIKTARGLSVSEETIAKAIKRISELKLDRPDNCTKGNILCQK